MANGKGGGKDSRKGRREKDSAVMRWNSSPTAAIFKAVFVLLIFLSTSARAQVADISLLQNNQSALEGFRSDAWYLPDDDLLGFVAIPAGVFRMGSNPALDRWAYTNERWSASSRQGRVDLPLFYIARYETTVAQYRAFLESSGYKSNGQVTNAPLNHPVSFVSWTDALAYSRWLQREMMATADTPIQLKQLFEAGWRISIPSEAEWEKAARGTDAKVFPWGNLPVKGQANSNSRGLMPVGSFECSRCSYGLSDMSGNVWELTRSPLQPYPYDETDDRDLLTEDALWVMRGGSYNDPETSARSAIRGGVDPGVRNATIGFRVVISRF